MDQGPAGFPRTTPARPAARPRRARALAALAAASLVAVGGRPGSEGAPFEVALPYTPLAPPLVVTGGFCEYRVGHFHAGLDLGTGQRVGKPVQAPMGGQVERLRASGVGYGRSVYLRTDDGRLLQFGHLDALAEPLASFVRAVQDSSGQYEQDLWPEPGRFRFRAGETLAWTGESGAGGPHLHFEIRRGDIAYHPFRAGLAPRDTTPPALVSVTLEPLDDTSAVEGGFAPHVRRLTARPDTLRVRGRVRVVVGARDGAWHGVDRMVPWSVGLEWGGRTVECRFDSVSWATDMAESDYVYDAGRVVGDKGLVLWAPPGFRPRALRASAPLHEEAGTVSVRAADPARTLKLWALDLGGNRAERSLVILPAVGGPDTLRAGGAPAAGPRLEFASLPGGFLRITDRGAPAGSRGVRFLLDGSPRAFPATSGPRGFTAVLPLGPGRGRAPGSESIGVEGLDAAGRRWLYAVPFAEVVAAPHDSCVLGAGGFRAVVPAGAMFERSVLVVQDAGRPTPGGELAATGGSFALGPEKLPLRRGARVSLAWEPGRPSSDAGLCRESGDGWEWLGGGFDSAARRFAGESRRLGRFAVLRDTLAPRVTLRRPGRSAPSRPYSRWALEARVTERGSGVDPRASYFVVGGRRVATEWDAEERTLRWRPARRPAAGTHSVVAMVTDRAGNARRRSGSFVLD